MPDVQVKESCQDAKVTSTLYEDALGQILENVNPVIETEKLPIRDAFHRVAAEDVAAGFNVPSHRNSAMDGYACHFEDLTNDKISYLKLVGASTAGHPFHGEVGHGDCIRILTGAVIPENLDTIVIQEDTNVVGDQVHFADISYRQGQHVREAGEDITEGELALRRGQIIGTAELGLLASVNHSEILAYRKPVVAFFSTGDELRSVGKALEPGEIYDSNRYTLFGMLTELHVDLIDLGVVADNLDDTVDALKEGASKADIVISCAGASVGDSDFVAQALEILGELTFWKVAMKPGRPLAFGKINDARFFGLPGNPVSVMVTFDKFVKPALKKLKGERQSQPIQIDARCTREIKKIPGRLEFQRGIFSYDSEGNAIVESTGNQSSGVLTSMSRANCYIVLPLETGNLPAGTVVRIEPFETSLARRKSIGS